MIPRVPPGFRLTGVHCGIKKDATKEDLALVVADRPSVAAGVYTQNVVVAAPVMFNRRRTPYENFRAVVANSGNANACTGERGLRDAEQTARLAADACGLKPDQVLVLSTGVIGLYLPMENIATGIRDAAARLGNDEASFLAAARGIMTTDRFHKVAGRKATIRGQEVQVTGMAKGAGMIGPSMATMLALVMTDARLAAPDAQRILAAAADQSFNCISVEGHTSTNDTVLLLASGAAHDRPLATEELPALQAAVSEVCLELARMIPDDGEGASHLITIDVRGCARREDALCMAKAIANSPLVKTGIAGADPNWGRLISAAGMVGIPFDPHRATLTVNGTVLFRNGEPVPFDAPRLSSSIRSRRDTQIELDFCEGQASVRFWTSDLTADYVRLNSEYTT